MAGLREECERGNRSRHGSGASSSGDGLDYPRVDETLSVIVNGLREKRQDASRPEDLTVSTGMESLGGCYLSSSLMAFIQC